MEFRMGIMRLARQEIIYLFLWCQGVADLHTFLKGILNYWVNVVKFTEAVIS